MNLLFNLLFFLCPLIYTSVTSELFEIPKMHFIYFFTVIIVALHLFNYLRGRVKLYRPHPLFWFFLFFLLSQIISTIFSVDRFTSLFGYYSRLNGGLLSLTCYFLLFCVFSVYVNDKLKRSIITSGLLSGLIVAAYGIAQHFGIDKSMWLQDVQSRVFSTLGQPDWLAAYLCVLLPFALNRFFNSKSESWYGQDIALSLTFIFYLCLLFTKSKSGLAAAAVSLAIYLYIYVSKTIKNKQKFNLAKAAIIIVFFISSSILIKNPIRDIFFPVKNAPDLNNPNQALNITPSEDIRKLVWAGAFQLWQRFPLFGTGPETFAYTYYWVRPAAHNLTSEWDFLYNKAHNEYLNYLATTGSFGFLTYLAFILYVLYSFYQAPLSRGGGRRPEGFELAIFSAFTSILITNAAGFSISIISLYFFLLPVVASAKTGSDDTPVFISQKPKLWQYLVFLPFAFLALEVILSFTADIAFAKSQNLDSASQFSAAADYINVALALRPDTPDYLIKSGEIYAQLALTTKSADFTAKAINDTNRSLIISPFNINLWKQRAQNYYYLSGLDSKYYLDTLASLHQAAKLAPTDAKTFYLLGEFYDNIHATPQAVEYYRQALTLKSNYDLAAFALGKIYFVQKKYSDAKPLFEKTLQIAPANLDAQNYLNLISTASATSRK